MKVVLVSRYPHVDTMGWKRVVAERLRDGGCRLEVLYSRASIADQARAGLREDGLGLFRRFAALRGRRPGGPGPARSLSTWAAEQGIPVHRRRRLGDAGTLAVLRDAGPDLLVLLGADIVPASVLRIPRLGTINAHYGLLPAYRGMNVTEWSLHEGAEIGVSVHLVDAGIDTGDILEREPIAIPPGATLASLRVLHQELAADLLPRAALGLRDGTAERTPQAPGDGRQYYRMHPLLRRRVEARLASGEAR